MGWTFRKTYHAFNYYTLDYKIYYIFLWILNRNVTKIQLIAPEYDCVATMNDTGILAIYEAATAKLVSMILTLKRVLVKCLSIEHKKSSLFKVLAKFVKGSEISFQASPADPVLAVFGEENGNYGIVLETFNHKENKTEGGSSMCLTHQIVSLVTFSPTGRHLVAAAMSAGHIFIFKVCFKSSGFHT